MKKANPTAIGSFVLIGLALVIGAVLLFSKGDLFATKEYYSIYFRQNVNGLNVGAPVKFLGIQIGSVIQIDGLFDRSTGEVLPRIVIEVVSETVTESDAELRSEQLAILELLLSRGARARLQAQSILTGQLYVSIEFHPDTPIRYLAGPEEVYVEIPSLDSGLEEAIASLQSVIDNADKAMATIQQLLTSDDFKAGLDRVDAAVVKFDKLVADIDKFVGDANIYVTQDLTAATTSLTQTLDTARSDIHSLTDKVSNQTLVNVDQALLDIQNLVDQVAVRVGKEDPLNYEVIKTMRDLQSAARRIKELAAYLEQHPEALLKGKNLQ